MDSINGVTVMTLHIDQSLAIVIVAIFQFLGIIITLVDGRQKNKKLNLIADGLQLAANRQGRIDQAAGIVSDIEATHSTHALPVTAVSDKISDTPAPKKR